MALTLILTRHAKSDWGAPHLDDFDRPLNDRGHRAAPAIGAWLAGHGLTPGEVIVSGARRTVETWDGIAGAFADAPTARSERRLYDATPDTIMAVLRGASAPVTMLIGHNPGVGQLARRLATAAPAHPRFADYPTCATTVFRFHREAWQDIGWGEAQVADFVVPRDLPGQ